MSEEEIDLEEIESRLYSEIHHSKEQDEDLVLPITTEVSTAVPHRVSSTYYCSRYSPITKNRYFENTINNDSVYIPQQPLSSINNEPFCVIPQPLQASSAPETAQIHNHITLNQFILPQNAEPIPFIADDLGEEVPLISENQIEDSYDYDEIKRKIGIIRKKMKRVKREKHAKQITETKEKKILRQKRNEIKHLQVLQDKTMKGKELIKLKTLQNQQKALLTIKEAEEWQATQIKNSDNANRVAFDYNEITRRLMDINDDGRENKVNTFHQKRQIFQEKKKERRHLNTLLRRTPEWKAGVEEKRVTKARHVLKMHEINSKTNPKYKANISRVEIAKITIRQYEMNKKAYQKENPNKLQTMKFFERHKNETIQNINLQNSEKDENISDSDDCSVVEQIKNIEETPIVEIKEEVTSIHSSSDNDEVVFVENEPEPVINLEPEVTILPQPELADPANTSIQSNDTESSDKPNSSLKENVAAITSKERKELLSTPESNASNDFLDPSNVDNSNNQKFNFALHGSDFTESEFVRPATPTEILYETESSCSTTDFPKDFNSSLKSVVFSEVEFPKDDLFQGSSLEGFSSYITPKRVKKSVSKDAKSTPIADSTTKTDNNEESPGSSSEESDYETNETPNSNKVLKKGMNLMGQLPDLSPMCMDQNTSTPKTSTKKKSKKKNKEVVEESGKISEENEKAKKKSNKSTSELENETNESETPKKGKNDDAGHSEIVEISVSEKSKKAKVKSFFEIREELETQKKNEKEIISSDLLELTDKLIENEKNKRKRKKKTTVQAESNLQDMNRRILEAIEISKDKKQNSNTASENESTISENRRKRKQFDNISENEESSGSTNSEKKKKRNKRNSEPTPEDQEVIEIIEETPSKESSEKVKRKKKKRLAYENVREVDEVIVLDTSMSEKEKKKKKKKRDSENNSDEDVIEVTHEELVLDTSMSEKEKKKKKKKRDSENNSDEDVIEVTHEKLVLDTSMSEKEKKKKKKKCAGENNSDEDVIEVTHEELVLDTSNNEKVKKKKKKRGDSDNVSENEIVIVEETPDETPSSEKVRKKKKKRGDSEQNSEVETVSEQSSENTASATKKKKKNKALDENLPDEASMRSNEDGNSSETTSEKSKRRKKRKTLEESETNLNEKESESEMGELARILYTSTAIIPMADYIAMQSELNVSTSNTFEDFIDKDSIVEPIPSEPVIEIEEDSSKDDDLVIIDNIPDPIALSSDSDTDMHDLDTVGHDMSLANLSTKSTTVKLDDSNVDRHTFKDHWHPDKEIFYGTVRNSNFDVDAIQNTMSDDPGRWKILPCDKDMTLNASPSGPRCHRCRQKGHMAVRCPNKEISNCALCGMPGHHAPRCPNKLCTQCGNAGNYSTNFCHICVKFRNRVCSLCKMKGHLKDYCPDLWRRYHLTTGEGPIVVPKGPEMKPRNQWWCSACAKSGHLEHTCYYINREYPAVDPRIVKYEDIYGTRAYPSNSFQGPSTPSNNFPEAHRNPNGRFSEPRKAGDFSGSRKYSEPMPQHFLDTRNVMPADNNLNMVIQLANQLSQNNIPPLNNMPQNFSVHNTPPQMQYVPNMPNAGMQQHNPNQIPSLFDIVPPPQPVQINYTGYMNFNNPAQEQYSQNFNAAASRPLEVRSDVHISLSNHSPSSTNNHQIANFIRTSGLAEIQTFIKDEIYKLSGMCKNAKFMRKKYYYFEALLKKHGFKCSKRVQKELSFWFRTLNMFLFGVHKLGEGKKYLDHLKNVLQLVPTHTITSVKRDAILLAYNYIFGSKKHDVDYRKFIQAIILKNDKQGT